MIKLIVCVTAALLITLVISAWIFISVIMYKPGELNIWIILYDFFAFTFQCTAVMLYSFKCCLKMYNKYFR
jgi:hypothetical protein